MICQQSKPPLEAHLFTLHLSVLVFFKKALLASLLSSLFGSLRY